MFGRRSKYNENLGLISTPAPVSEASSSTNGSQPKDTTTSRVTHYFKPENLYLAGSQMITHIQKAISPPQQYSEKLPFLNSGYTSAASTKVPRLKTAIARSYPATHTAEQVNEIFSHLSTQVALYLTPAEMLLAASSTTEFKAMFAPVLAQCYRPSTRETELENFVKRLKMVTHGLNSKPSSEMISIARKCLPFLVQEFNDLSYFLGPFQMQRNILQELEAIKASIPSEELPASATQEEKLAYRKACTEAFNKLSSAMTQFARLTGTKWEKTSALINTGKQLQNLLVSANTLVEKAAEAQKVLDLQIATEVDVKDSLLILTKEHIKLLDRAGLALRLMKKSRAALIDNIQYAIVIRQAYILAAAFNDTYKQYAAKKHAQAWEFDLNDISTTTSRNRLLNIRKNVDQVPTNEWGLAYKAIGTEDPYSAKVTTQKLNEIEVRLNNAEFFRHRNKAGMFGRLFPDNTVVDAPKPVSAPASTTFDDVEIETEHKSVGRRPGGGYGTFD
jgi:hypothetical protein